MKLALRFFLVLLLMGGGIAAIHFNIFPILQKEPPFSFSLLAEMHLIIFGLTALVLIGILAVAKHFPDKVGFAFLGSVLFKMVLVASYFIIRMKALPNPPDKQFILHFFGVYFIYLAIETLLVYNNLLKNK
jgi:hypothetical protein